MWSFEQIVTKYYISQIASIGFYFYAFANINN